jgi:taurine dioxygenase
VNINDIDNIAAVRVGRDVGAEITGVDVAQPLSDAAFGRILQLFHQHGVVFFRRQRLTPRDLRTFSARFGELDIHHMTEHTLPEIPEVRVLSNVKKDGRATGITRGGMHWHSDLSYKKVPALATLLYGIECPPEGADTQFVSMCTAYETLSPDLREKIRGRSAVHDRNFRYSELYPNRPPLTPEQVAKVPPVEHPLVRLHRESGRAALFVAKDVVSHVVGMSLEESRPIIDALEAHATRANSIYSHKWQEGDLVVWDNRCTLHRATPYDNKYNRTLHRTQVKGEVPVPA